MGKLANYADRASLWSEKSPGKSGSLVSALSTLGGLALEFWGFDAQNIHALGAMLQKFGGFLQTM